MQLSVNKMWIMLPPRGVTSHQAEQQGIQILGTTEEYQVDWSGAGTEDNDDNGPERPVEKMIRVPSSSIMSDNISCRSHTRGTTVPRGWRQVLMVCQVNCRHCHYVASICLLRSALTRFISRVIVCININIIQYLLKTDFVVLRSCTYILTGQ